MADNVQIAGGMLRLTARRESSAWASVTTGAVETRDKAFWNGPFRMCVFAQLPTGDGGTGAGYSPAFRLLPNDDSCPRDHGELAFAEQRDGGDNVTATYRTAPAGAPACGNVTVSSGGAIEEVMTFFNEYAIEVDADGGFFFIVNDDYVAGTGGHPTHVVPRFLNLGLGVGATNASTAFPAVVNIDWIQVVARASSK